MLPISNEFGSIFLFGHGKRHHQLRLSVFLCQIFHLQMKMGGDAFQEEFSHRTRANI